MSRRKREPRTYLGIDPGVNTGIFRWDEAEPEGHEWWETRDLQQIKTIVDNEVALAKALARPLTIVTEKFTIGSHTIRGHVYYESVYINGWLLIEHDGLVVMQGTAIAKKENEDRKSVKITRLGWYHRTKDGHANDAAAHVMARAEKDRCPYVLEVLTNED